VGKEKREDIPEVPSGTCFPRKNKIPEKYSPENMQGGKKKRGNKTIKKIEGQ